jgi:hypothetical protein
MLRALAPAFVAAAALLAGCGALGGYVAEADVIVDGAPAGPCVVEPVPGLDPFLQCPLAVELAAAKLGLFPGPARAVEFHRGALCPPNARCRPLTDRGSVIFWFGGGTAPLLVRVTPDGAGGYVAEEPEAPPRWLLDLDQHPEAGMRAT